MSRLSGLAALIALVGCSQQGASATKLVSSPNQKTPRLVAKAQRSPATTTTAASFPLPACTPAPAGERERSEAQMAGLPARGTRIAGSNFPTLLSYKPEVALEEAIALTPISRGPWLLLTRAMTVSSAVLVVRYDGESSCVLGSRFFGLGKRTDVDFVNAWESPSKPLTVSLLRVTDWSGTGQPGSQGVISWFLLATDGNDVWSPSRGLGGLQGFRAWLDPSGDTVALRATSADGRSRTFALSADAHSLVPLDNAPFVSITYSALDDEAQPFGSFGSHGYPAIDPTGNQIAVLTSDQDGISTLPNARVELLPAAAGAPLVHALLAENAMKDALLVSDPVARARELSRLQSKVEERLDDVNQTVDDRWKPLSPCEGPTPDFWTAAMGGGPQTGVCGKTKYRYERARISWGPSGTEHSRALPRARGQTLKTPDGPLVLRDALSRAFYDAKTQSLLLQIDYSMPAGGDSYGQATDWELVTLR